MEIGKIGVIVGFGMIMLGVLSCPLHVFHPLPGPPFWFWLLLIPFGVGQVVNAANLPIGDSEEVEV